MRAILFLCFLWLFSYSASGQDLSELNKRNGFKSIHLGDDRSKYSTQIQYDAGRDVNGDICYIFHPNDSDLFNVFNYRMDIIYLMFNKRDKLTYILLVKQLKYADDNNHMQTAIQISKSISESLRSIIGRPTSILNTDDDSGGRIGSIWTSSKIVAASYIHYYGAFTGTDVKFLIEDSATSSFNPNKGF